MASVAAGETRAWEQLSACDPGAVCSRAGADYDPRGGEYRVLAFGRVVAVRTLERRVLAPDAPGAAFLERFGPFFELALLWYLARASGAVPSGSLVKPSGLPGGEIFARGSHVLPLDALAAKYARRPAEFLAAGIALGGAPVGCGDVAIELRPFPKVPVTALLWTEDDEFPARADLLFDATAPRHLPTDVLWSVALVSTLALM